MNKKILLLISFAFAATQLNAQTQPQNKQEKKFYVELRPLQFFLEGYSVVGHYALNDRMQIGANVFAATLSDGITDLVWDTEGSLDLEARQDIVIGLSYRYFLAKDKPHQGWFLGVVAGAEFYTLANQNDHQELDYTFYYLAPRIGYIWYPFKNKLSNFYVSGEAVAVFPLINDGEVTFNSRGTAEINGVLPSPLIGIGFRF